MHIACVLSITVHSGVMIIDAMLTCDIFLSNSKMLSVITQTTIVLSIMMQRRYAYARVIMLNTIMLNDVSLT